MNLVEQAFKGLFPEKEFGHTAEIRYSGRFKGYNANVLFNRLTKHLKFNLSRQWRHVDNDIKIGLLQELLARFFRTRKKTINIDLYSNFLKNVHIAVPKTKSHPLLEESFNRVNALFFAGMIDKPNLVLGAPAARTMGNYDYGTDTIKISAILQDHQDLLDYVMYHEILHKHQKFRNKNHRNYHHTSEFRQKEKEYPNAKLLEEKLMAVIRNARPRKRRFLFF